MPIARPDYPAPAPMRRRAGDAHAKASDSHFRSTAALSLVAALLLVRPLPAHAAAPSLPSPALPPPAPSTSSPAPLPQAGLRDGRQIFLAACAACHGSGGEGTPQYVAGFEQPDTFPHFNKCDESEPESTRDWTAIIREGGPARGYSQIMPAFGSALNAQQIEAVVRYLRGLCTDPAWPPGELNVPRALVTEKAFPESEAIITSTVNARGRPGVDNELEYENTLGPRDELDLELPFGWVSTPRGGIFGGIGDLTAGLKHVLFAHLGSGSAPLYTGTGSILSVQGQITLPSGNASEGLGTGQTQLGGFAAFDVVLPAQAFVQIQAGGNQPLRSSPQAPATLFLYTAIGRSFNQGMGFARQWSPMLEATANRSLAPGQGVDWALVPQFQVTLSARQHVRADLGYVIPINDTAQQPRQIMLYVLWDWFDGGLFEGW